ncbi:MAG: hypothetical protein KGO82_18575 [Bacteroidota bacterium]|nr:hypothetical protein [Bacteroidota bacterium]
MAKTIAGILLVCIGLVGLRMATLLNAGHTASTSMFERLAWMIASVGLIAIGFKALSKPKS